jgi:hypothetical protein
MPYFIKLCEKRLKHFTRHTQSHDYAEKSLVGFFEANWDNPKVKAGTESGKIVLRQRAEQTRKNRANLISEKSAAKSPRERFQEDQTVYEESQFDAVCRLVDLCRSRHIFVVICVPPQWYGQLNFTQKDLEQPTDEPYLVLLRELNERHDCTVIICRDFEEITNEGTDEDYLIDGGHMTRKGAIVYTNWLVDRLMAMPKAAEAMQERSVVR